MKKIRKWIIFFFFISAAGTAYWFVGRYFQEAAVMKQIIARLEADSRVAEVLVTGLNYDEVSRRNLTTIKFLEYNSRGAPLEPRYFTFAGNIIQFQSLVIRFDDRDVRHGSVLRGKSAYFFWKVFMLDGANTQEYEITEVDAVPDGYKIEGRQNPFEEKLWKEFWAYALDPAVARQGRVKNAQIEAPGTMFIPGYLYTIEIEHDGGMRIDAAPVSKILKGEQIL